MTLAINIGDAIAVVAGDQESTHEIVTEVHHADAGGLLITTDKGSEMLINILTGEVTDVGAPPAKNTPKTPLARLLYVLAKIWNKLGLIKYLQRLDYTKDRERN